MNKKFQLTTLLLNKCKHFYHNQQGVYAVMTALLAFPLLFLVAFTVDGTGMLLDRARLAQATDQSALLLVAENNLSRDNPKHSDVNRQNVNAQEIKEMGGNAPNPEERKFRAQQQKRNQELVQGIVKVYLRSYGKDSDRTSAPITIPKDFDTDCKATDDQHTNANGRQKTVACMVQGIVERKSWLPWNHSLNSADKPNNDRISINSGVSYAVKERSIAVPVDLMMVTDLSGSMKDRLKGKTTKISDLRDVVKTVSSLLLPEKSNESVSPYNRIGFAAFAQGARERDVKEKCVLPYKMKSGNQTFNIRGDHASIFGHRINPSTCPSVQLTNSIGRKYWVRSCSIKDDPSRVLKLAINEKIYYPSDPQRGYSLWDSVTLMFDQMLDIPGTLAEIDKFDGTKRNYPFEYENGNYCLGGNTNVATTQAWFGFNEEKKKWSDVSQAFNSIKPEGGTAVTSGMLIGTNLLVDNINDKTLALAASNTRRVLLVLSDGEDNAPTFNTLINLINGGLCTKIREKVNKLQDSRYPILNTRIAFVAFGFNPPANQKKAWQQCVDDKQYYEVESRDELLEAFKQIISFEEEVGTSSSSKPDLLK